MGAFYKNIFSLALKNTPSLLSSNWAGVLVSVLIFLATFVLRVTRKESWKTARNWGERLTAVRGDWKQNARDGALVVLIAWTLVFLASLVKTVYTDHKTLSDQVDHLQKQLDTAHLVSRNASAPVAKAGSVNVTRRAIQKRISQFISSGNSLRNEWVPNAFSPDQQRAWALCAWDWHKSVEAYLKTIPRGDIYLVRFRNQVGTLHGYPGPTTPEGFKGWDMLMSDLTRLNEFLEDPELGAP
jgi:hypothetical protein